METLSVGDLPSELTCNPLAYVALVGLDVSNNAVHKAIWESFTSSRPERVPISLKLLPEGYEFHKAKQKRTSYDWYVPKGILKTNWMKKHLSEIPSVAIQFVDLDWDSPAWLEKRSECVHKIETLRASLQGRSTRVALVLIQKHIALPGTDDQIASERAAFLCSACDLSGKTLFVLPHTDHLHGYTLRLQNAFCELSQTYYHHESRRIKNHKDHLNKTTHQLLFVRHQFKIAFLTELKQEFPVALKSYKQAYANLMEIRATDANILEIKTIAGFINYKMAKLSFLNGTPLDAIAQFRKHIDIFKNKLGCPELAFEHSAWMSKQFSHFGDLFEEAVQQGLNAIQTQHPGFYYQQAANHASARKQACLKLCKSVQEPSDPDILQGADSLEFYGQRPWRPCCQSLEPPDPQRELEGIQALKYKEFQEVQHSDIIIPFLSSAISQFKKYKCPRMKRQLTVVMGEEYYYCNDYSKALTLLKHVLWDYRLEKWRPIVSSVVWTSLKCAYLSVNIQEYINLGLEVISYWIIRNTEEKSIIQFSIGNLLQHKSPTPFPTISDDENNKAAEEWSAALASLQLPQSYTIQMASIVPFIECKAGFGSADYVIDQKVVVTVFLRMNCPQPMAFSKLTVLFNNSVYNKFCTLPTCDESSAGDQHASTCKLNLVPRNDHTYNFTFNSDPQDLNKDIQIASIALHLGSKESMSIVLHWANNGTPSSNATVFINRGSSFSDDPAFQHMPLKPTTKILPRNAKIKLDVKHEPPALVNEFYAFVVSVVNEEIRDITNLSLSAVLKDREQSQYTHLSEKAVLPESFSQCLQNIELGKLPPGQEVKKLLYMRAASVGSRAISFEVNYDIDVDMGENLLHCSCKKLHEVEIHTMEPFHFMSKILSMKHLPQTSVRVEEPFLLRLDIVCFSPIPVILENATLILDKEVKSVDATASSQIENLFLKPQEASTDCFCLVTLQECSSKLTLGVYQLKWKRKSSLCDLESVDLTFVLPTVDVVVSPIFMELEHPAHGWVRKPMTVTYHLHNRLSNVQEVQLLVDNSGAFMYSGNKQVHFRVLPRDVFHLVYNLYPLTPGYVPLPQLKITLNPGTSLALSIDDLVREMIPTHIFVMPQGRNKIEDQSNV